MATYINDLGQAALVKPSLAPQTIETSNPIGSAADLGEGDGACFAIQVIGAVNGEPGLAGRIEESNDQTTWAAISGAVFAAATAPATQVIRFLRSRRYVRWAGAYQPGEGDTIAASAIVLQCKKTI